MFKKYRVVSKVRFTLFIITAIVIILGSAAMLMKPAYVIGSSEPTFDFVTVESGDTLWDIATRYSSDETDIRKFIYEISSLNDIDGTALTPGQEIKIPR